MGVQTPIGRLPAWAVVTTNVVFWPCWMAAVGFVAARASDQRFSSEDFVTRVRPFEERGRWYRDRLAIHRWKDRLPEAGTLFGGYSKRQLHAHDRAALERFALETRRAEHAHWGMLAGAVVTTLWNPPWAFPINAGVGAGVNLPCLLVQRYNRARLEFIASAATSE